MVGMLLVIPRLVLAQAIPAPGSVTSYVEVVDPQYIYSIYSISVNVPSMDDALAQWNAMATAMPDGLYLMGIASDPHPKGSTLVNGYSVGWYAAITRYVYVAGVLTPQTQTDGMEFGMLWGCPSVNTGEPSWQMVSIPVNDGTGSATVTCQRTVSIPVNQSTPANYSTPQNTCPRDDYQALKVQSGLFTPNPISVATGEKLRIETDYSGSGPQPLVLTRGYLSDGNFNSGMGPNWWHNQTGWISFSDWVNAASNGLSVNAGLIAPTPAEQSAWGANHRADIQLPDGSTRTFILNNTTWTAMGNLDTLVQSSTELVYHAVDDDTSYHFNNYGQLISAVLPNGWTTQYAYNPNGQLASVTNQFGQSLGFAYNSAGALSQVSTPDGGIISYSYAANQNLQQVSYPDGSSRSFFYENPTFPNALTGIAVNGSRIATYAYNSAGKPVSTVGVNGVDSYQVGYDYDLGYKWDTITDPLGIQRSYSYGASYGRTAVLWSIAPNDQPGDAASRVQDPNTGLITGVADFNGNTATYGWDTNRFLLTSKVEVSPAPASATVRTSSTAWHPNYRLPQQQAKPGTLTTSVYNGQPDPFSGGAVASCAPASALNGAGAPIPVLCKRVEQATTDSNGSAGLNASLNPNVPNRVWSWTYNANAQVLSATDARGNTESYTYDGSGNRIGEQTADPQGNLTRQVSRLLNGLGRLQQVTGME